MMLEGVEEEMDKMVSQSVNELGSGGGCGCCIFCSRGVCVQTDVWIAFGTGINFRYLHINAICKALGREKAIALPIFTQLLAVIQLLHFLGKGRRQHGIHGKHSQRLQRHFFTWQSTCSSQY